MVQVQRTASAPVGLGIEAIGVPDGSDLDLDVRFESVQEGVLVTATVTAPVVGACSRCLDPVVSTETVVARDLYVYEDKNADSSEPYDEETPRTNGDFLDIEPMVRDDLVIELPLAPLCRDDCPGLCSECGARLADDLTHQHDEIDPRWAALRHVAVGSVSDERNEQKET
jgi:uncharacterized protein